MSYAVYVRFVSGKWRLTEPSLSSRPSRVSTSKAHNAAANHRIVKAASFTEEFRKRDVSSVTRSPTECHPARPSTRPPSRSQSHRRARRQRGDRGSFSAALILPPSNHFAKGASFQSSTVCHGFCQLSSAADHANPEFVTLISNGRPKRSQWAESLHECRCRSCRGRSQHTSS